MTKYGAVSVSNADSKYGFLIPESTNTTYNYFRISTWDLTNINTLTCRVKLIRSVSSSSNAAKITVNGTTVLYESNTADTYYYGTTGKEITIDLSGYTDVQYLSFEARGYFSMFVTEIAIS